MRSGQQQRARCRAGRRRRRPRPGPHSRGPPSSSGSGALSDPRSFRTSGAGGDHSRCRRRHHARPPGWPTSPCRPGAPLKPLAKRLAAAEITVGNFESTLSADGSPTQGGDSFAASPRVRPGLRAAGFDLLSLANNHVGDYGDGALRQTLARFDSGRIQTVGAGRNLDAARRPVIIERDGVRVGFLAVDSIGETPAATRTRSGTNRLNMPPRTGPLNRSHLRRISSDIRALDSRVDAVVVLTHWGTQYTHRPESSQRIASGPSPTPARIW